MLTVRAALAAVAVCLGAQAPVHATEPVTVNDAFKRVIDTHPELAVLRFSEVALGADADRAAQAPPLRLDASVENALGTGAASGLGGIELTVSLASVIERGDKRAARMALGARRVEGVELLREGKRLDLLAEVARRYLDALSARAVAQLIRDDLAQRERLADAAARRVRSGGTPEATFLAADAARIRGEADLAQARRRELHALRRLATLWGDTHADLALAGADLSLLPAVPDYTDLVDRLGNTPELRRFAHEARLREARLQLARTARTPDLDWQVGVRRLQADSDWGLVGSVSIPFGSAVRAAPDIRAADAELSAIEFEREGVRRMLQATLAEAWGQLDLAVSTAQHIDSDILPALQRAAAAAERAYRAGAAGYLEWAQLQSDITTARRERLDAGLAAHRALIELQRLTGETFQVAGGAHAEETP